MRRAEPSFMVPVSNPTTPGTRRKWSDLGEWLAVWCETRRRRDAYPVGPGSSATL